MTGKVIAGDYKGKSVAKLFNNKPEKKIVIELGILKRLFLNKETVESYQIMECTHEGRFWVEVNFKDGKRSLIAMDPKYYEALELACL